MDNANNVIVRVDERTKSIQSELKQFRIDVTARFNDAIDKIKENEIRYNQQQMELESKYALFMEDVKKSYVKNDSFTPVKLIVYGFVSLILTTVIGALLTTIILK